MLILAGIVIYLIIAMFVLAIFHGGKDEKEDERYRRLKWLMDNGYTFEQALSIVDAGE